MESRRGEYELSTMSLMLCLLKKKVKQSKMLKFGKIRWQINTWVLIILVTLFCFLEIFHTLKKELELPEVTSYYKQSQDWRASGCHNQKRTSGSQVCTHNCPCRRRPSHFHTVITHVAHKSY